MLMLFGTLQLFLLSCNTGAFKLYDADSDGYITREDMYMIVESIYQMLGNQTQSNETESISLRERVDKIFQQLDTVCRVYSVQFG